MANQPNEDRADSLPAQATEFIRQVVCKMGYHQTARQEVEAELMAHFEDELRDCPDGPEREQRVLRLIEGFGDAKLLAILCRRSKKRCRPLREQMMVRSLQVAGVCVVLLCFYVVWFVNGKPSVEVDYLALLNQMNRPEIAPQDNAWPYYERAIALAVAPSSELAQMPAYQHPDFVENLEFGGLSEDAQRAIVHGTEENRAAWEQFALAGAKPYFARSYQYSDSACIAKVPWLLHVKLPNQIALRDLGLVGLWSSRRSVQQGRIDEALDACLAVARAGRHWQQGGSVIEQLTGLGLAQRAHQEILHIVGHQALSGAQLSDLQRRVVSLYPPQYPPVDMRFERLVFLDMLQHVFTGAGPGGGHLIPSASAHLLQETMDGRPAGGEAPLVCKIPFVWTSLSLIHAGRDETLAKTDRIFDAMREQALLNPYERHLRQAPTVDEMVRSLPAHRYALVQTLVPALDRAAELNFRGKALHEATLTVLALQRYRREKGSYPVALEELKKAGLLEVLPRDPYAGTLLSYQRSGSGFTLYSVGPDFQDNGGARGRGRAGRPMIWADQGDTVFWPVP